MTSLLKNHVLDDTVTAATQTAGDNSTKIATTAYADAAGGGGGLSAIFSAGTLYTGNAWGTTPTVLALELEITDSSGVYNPTTHVFTAPSDGLYQFTVSLNLQSFQGSDAVNIHLYKNTGAVFYYSFSAPSTSFTASFTWIESLSASDTIDVRGENNTGTRGTMIPDGTCFIGYKIA